MEITIKRLSFWKWYSSMHTIWWIFLFWYLLYFVSCFSLQSFLILFRWNSSDTHLPKVWILCFSILSLGKKYSFFFWAIMGKYYSCNVGSNTQPIVESRTFIPPYWNINHPLKQQQVRLIGQRTIYTRLDRPDRDRYLFQRSPTD